MTILITGGAGFIGGNFILDWFNGSDENVVNLDKLTYAGNLITLTSLKNDPRHDFVKGDINDRELLRSLLERHVPRAIIHFAAESHVDRSICGPEQFIQSNILGTYNLLQTALDYWTNLPASKKSEFKFIHISTDEVYGSLSPSTPAFVETDPYQPNSPYSASKAASDHLVRAWRETYGFPALTVNCSNNYGPYQFPEKLIPLMVLNAISGKILPVYGDGKQIRDWLYVKDHCCAIHTILRTGRAGAVYNVGGSSEMVNLDLVNQICAILDECYPRTDKKPYKDQICHVKDRAGHDVRYAVDASLIRKELGWRPQTSLKEGLRNTVIWYVNNRNWCELVLSQSSQNKKKADALLFKQ